MAASTVAAALQARIFATAIIDLLPHFKMHHVVCITASGPLVYTVDFTPLDRSWGSKLQLLFGASVPAEIRIRNILATEDIVQQWSSMTRAETVSESQLRTNETVALVTDPDIRAWIASFYPGRKEMHLYTHNCQHFGQHILSHPLVQTWTIP